jgi:hypothetical protein
MNSISTPAGRGWYTAALDPFHDYTQVISGLPDNHCTPSFCRMHVQSVSVDTATAGGTSIGVYFNGCSHATRKVTPVVNPILAFSSAADATLLEDPIMVVGGTAGSGPSLLGLPTSIGTSVKLAGLSLVPDTTTPHRVIAMGLEVHDTTAKLQQQGTISIAHCPGAWQESLSYTNNSTAGLGPIASLKSMPPALPATKSDLSYSPTMVEWESGKGAYIVGRLVRHDLCVPIEQLMIGSANNYCLPRESETRVASNGGYVYLVPTAPFVANVMDWNWSSATANPTGFQPFAVISEGLSASTTYRITLRTYVEYFPTMAHRSLLQNAMSSPSLDMTAFVEYYRALSALPTCVPVSMNAKGDWWRMVQNALRTGTRIALTAAPAVLTAAGQPALAGAATVLGTALSSALSRSQPARRAQAGQAKKKKQPLKKR